MALYNGEYYDAPYFLLKLNTLVNVKTKSFCFFVNYKYLEGKTNLAFYSSWNGGSNSVKADINWGTTTHKESSKPIFDGATTSYLSIDINYLNFNEEKWAFVKGKFWVDDVAAIEDQIPTVIMNITGGEEHIGEKTITCGWTFVAGDYDLLTFQYYPYNKNFFELFTEQNVQDGSITTERIMQ